MPSLKTPIPNDPMTRTISYHPVLVKPNEDEIILKYVMWIGLGAHISLDRKHLGRYILQKNNPDRTDEIIESGIKKYRDGVIPKHVHEDLSSGKCLKVILDYSSEGYYDIDFGYVSKIFGIEPSKLMWITGIWDPKFLDEGNEITIIWRNFWERFLNQKLNEKTELNSLEVVFNEDRQVKESVAVKGLRQQLQDIKELRTRKYHGLCYNRQPHNHRIQLMTRLKSEGVIDQTAYSWGGLYQGDEESYWSDPLNVDNELRVHKENGFLTDLDDEAFLETIKSPRIEFEGEDLTHNKAHSINFDHIKECYFQIITETMFINAKPLENGIQPTPFLSEKSYKPFISGMPFVMFGQTGTVKALRKQNYNCYDRWINHDYDDIIDDAERFQAALEETVRLSLIPTETWNSMLKDMLPYIKTNISQFNKNSIETMSHTEFGKFSVNYDTDGLTVRQEIYPDPDVLKYCFSEIT
ncbi:MAG: hypothetical protein H8E12_10855 [Rhodobacteraceae bacterium]|nr:hypothetical protein [Paracoccaceae bacterium]